MSETALEAMLNILLDCWLGLRTARQGAGGQFSAKLILTIGRFLSTLSRMLPKQRIGEAGLTVFARYGYRQATMELVADEAGMSRQALYRHFANKEQLFSAAIDMLHARALDAASKAAAQARARQQSTGEILVAQVLTRSEFLFMRLRGTAHGEELTQENVRLCGHIAVMYGARFAEQLAATIESEIAAGTFALRDDVTPAALARYLIAAARGIKTRVPPVDMGELRDEFRAMLPLIIRGAEADESAARKGNSMGRMEAHDCVSEPSASG